MFINYSKQYYTYVFGKIVLCKILKQNSKNSLLIQTEFGNKRNVDTNKVYENKNELIDYLIKNNLAAKFTQKYLTTSNQDLQNLKIFFEYFA